MNVLEAPGVGRGSVRAARLLVWQVRSVLGLHQLAGQPIEQLRMRWRIHARAEVLGCGNEALTKIGLPDTVDDHTRGSWTPFVHDPFCQAQPVTRRAFGERV